MEIIERHVEDAVAKGANVLVGGRRNPELKGLYYEPTVMTDVNHDMDIMRDETFGPVARASRRYATRRRRCGWRTTRTTG